MRMLLMPLALVLALPAMAQTVDPADDSADGAVEVGTRITREQVQIWTAMLDSAEGWNRGDIDRFLAIYSDDPETSFTGRDLARGKAGIRARYLTNYPRQFGAGVTPETRLSFTLEDFRMLGFDHALLIARWTLTKSGDAAATQTGMTSLLFRHEATGWKIIADHSS